MSASSGPESTPHDQQPPKSGKWVGVLAAGCALLAIGLVWLMGVSVYFVIMDPRFFLEKTWIGFFVGGTVVVALGAFLAARSIRMWRAQSR